MKDNLNLIPRPYPDLHTDSVKGKFFVYNPHSPQGVVFLPDTLYAVLTLVNGQRSLKTLYAKMGELLGPALFEAHIKALVRNRLIYFDRPEKEVLADDKPDTFAVWLHLTNQCNLSCSYCFIAKSNDHMDFGVLNKAAEKIMDSAFTHGYRKLAFTYAGGEPLLRFRELLDSAQAVRARAARKGMGVSFQVITNGTLLTERAIARLKEQDIKVIISIDGIGPYHDKTRYFKNKQGSFSYVMAGLERAAGNRVLDHVKVTISRHNVSEVPKMVSYFLKRNIRFRLQFFIDNPKAAVKTAPEEKDLIAALKKTYRIVEKNMPDYPFAEALLHTLRLYAPTHTCGAANHTFVSVRNDGQLANCNWWLEKNIGSVLDNDPLDLARKKGVIKPVSALNRKIACNTCQWRHICSGCPLEFYWDEKKTAGSYCKTKKALIPEVIRLEALRILKKKDSP